MNEISEDFIKKAQKEYQKISPLKCPAFKDTFVYFNKHGFNHLLRKGKDFRPQKDFMERFSLLPSAYEIISTAKNTSSHRIQKKGNSTAHFWALKGHIKGKKIRVILRKKNNGYLHLFSVMQE